MPSQRKLSAPKPQVIIRDDSDLILHTGGFFPKKIALAIGVFILLVFVFVIKISMGGGDDEELSESGVELFEDMDGDFADLESEYEGDADGEYEHPVDLEANTTVDYADKEKEFVSAVNKSLYEFKQRHNVVNLKHDIDEQELRELLTELASIYTKIIVGNIGSMPHVKSFFGNQDLIYHALYQQYKYGIPASVILANAADESSYGKSSLSRFSNNYFGIKAKKGYNGATCTVETPEEFTEKEYKAFKGQKKLKATKNVRGTKVYVVYIRDSFRKYSGVKESFEDFSRLLRNEDRYARIFQKGGADWQEWCNMFRPKREGGIPYATSTSKAQRLKDIIARNKLYLVDFTAS